MAMRPRSGKKPKRLGYTVKRLLGYMGRHKLLLFAVALLVTLSAGANLAGTYMIRPVVNSLTRGDWGGFVSGVVLTACIYGLGVLCSLGYTQCMVGVAQRVLFEIRRDLFAHMQGLPLSWFDSRNRGDVMSYFTNDVDTISDALNNSFALVIQSFIQMAGTLVLLFVLNWRLSLIVALCYLAMFLYIRYSGRRSRAYYNRQQAYLGELDGYIEEMVNGQKVVKVFNHEAANLEAFREKNDALRSAGTGAQAYAATMIPAVVSISYINYAIVSVLGGLMALGGLTDAGSLSSYLVFVRQAAMPINQFTQQSNFLLAALAGAERVFELLDERPETDEGGVVLVNARETAAGLEEAGEKTGRWAWRLPDGTLRPLRGDVRFEGVDFGYEPGHPVLHGVSLYAKPGQKIAFVGSTGAGKTTITNLKPFLRGRGRPGGLRRHRRARDKKGIPTPLAGHGAAGYAPLHGEHSGQHPLRKAGRDAGGDRGRGEDSKRGLLHPPPASGLRHAGDLGRGEPLPGPAPAPRHSPRRRG